MRGNVSHHFVLYMQIGAGAAEHVVYVLFRQVDDSAISLAVYISGILRTIDAL